MTNRKFYRTIYTVEVLSDAPIPEGLDLTDVLEEAHIGSYCADVKGQDSFTVDGKEMARLLTDQRSDPQFFDLNEEGDDLNEEGDDLDVGHDSAGADQ